MFEKRQPLMIRRRFTRDPFSLLRQMTSSLERAFDEWPAFRVQPFDVAVPESAAWSPKVDVFERDNRLVTRVDLPGMKKEDVTVEVTDGHLALSGERKVETEEKKDNIYRRERDYGSFYRAFPLPEGVKLEDVKATFDNGVLEVTVPLPALAETKPQKVQIEEPKPAKTAA